VPAPFPLPFTGRAGGMSGKTKTTFCHCRGERIEDWDDCDGWPA
jgi:hypothetical protein